MSIFDLFKCRRNDVNLKKEVNAKEEANDEMSAPSKEKAAAFLNTISGSIIKSNPEGTEIHMIGVLLQNAARNILTGAYGEEMMPSGDREFLVCNLTKLHLDSIEMGKLIHVLSDGSL